MIEVMLETVDVVTIKLEAIVGIDIRRVQVCK